MTDIKRNFEEFVMIKFAEWKGYPLPELNANGNFSSERLRHELVAFRAGIVCGKMGRTQGEF